MLKLIETKRGKPTGREIVLRGKKEAAIRETGVTAKQINVNATEARKAGFDFAK